VRPATLPHRFQTALPHIKSHMCGKITLNVRYEWFVCAIFSAAEKKELSV
jgi:hypothetical protein